MTATRLRVAVLGLGAMGSPMAQRLSSVHQVVGVDPGPERRDAATRAGLRVATTPAEAAADADTVLLAVRDHDQAHDALFGVGGAVETLPAGATVILTSTVGPEAARGLAETLLATGHLLVDAPVSGGPVRARDGDLLIVVGAEDAALTATRPVLERLSSTLVVVGPRPGDGQALKTVNQLLAGIHIAAAAEAVALARALGLDPELVVGALSTGAAGSFMLADRGPRMLQAYTGGAEVKSRVDIFVKDMGIVTDAGRDAHVPLPLAAAAAQLYLLAEAAGLGAADDSAVVTVLSPDRRS